MRALLIFVLVVAVGSLVMFVLYAAMDISRSVGGLALLGLIAVVIGWLSCTPPPLDPT